MSIYSLVRYLNVSARTLRRAYMTPKNTPDSESVVRIVQPSFVRAVFSVGFGARTPMWVQGPLQHIESWEIGHNGNDIN